MKSLSDCSKCIKMSRKATGITMRVTWSPYKSRNFLLVYKQDVGRNDARQNAVILAPKCKLTPKRHTRLLANVYSSPKYQRVLISRSKCNRRHGAIKTDSEWCTCFQSRSRKCSVFVCPSFTLTMLADIIFGERVTSREKSSWVLIGVPLIEAMTSPFSSI